MKKIIIKKVTMLICAIVIAVGFVGGTVGDVSAASYVSNKIVVSRTSKYSLNYQMTIYLNKSTTRKVINALDTGSGMAGAIAGISAAVPAGQAASPYIGAASGILYLHGWNVKRVSQNGKYPIKIVTKTFGGVGSKIPISYIVRQ